MDHEEYIREHETHVRTVRVEGKEDEYSEESMTDNGSLAKRVEEEEEAEYIKPIGSRRPKQTEAHHRQGETIQADDRGSDVQALAEEMIIAGGPEARKEVIDYIKSLRQDTVHIRKGRESSDCPLELSEWLGWIAAHYGPPWMPLN